MNEEMKDGLHIDPDGAKYWFKDGEIHREDGPAIEETDGSKDWMKYGTTHRIGGPAVEYSDGYNEYWLYGEPYLEYDEDEYNKAISNIPLLYWNRFKKGEWL